MITNQFRQETFEFSNERAALNFIIKMRRKHGRLAKLYLKPVDGLVYVKARFPEDDSPMDYKIESSRHKAMRVNAHTGRL